MLFFIGTLQFNLRITIFIVIYMRNYIYVQSYVHNFLSGNSMNKQ